MRLARITGRVSASIKSGKLTGVRMLVADYVDPEGEILERAVVITDACGAGPGDLVLVAGGSAARVPAETAGVPTDATLGGVRRPAFGRQSKRRPRPAAPPSPRPPAEAPRPPRSNRQRRK